MKMVQNKEEKKRKLYILLVYVCLPLSFFQFSFYKAKHIESVSAHSMWCTLQFQLNFTTLLRDNGRGKIYQQQQKNYKFFAAWIWVQ